MKMEKIFNLEKIKSVLPKIDLIKIIEEGFSEFSKGNVVVPPVGELIFENPPGDTHIKYGYIKNDDYYVIKIASGFYKNPEIGIPSGQGLMLVFCQKTGVLKAVLLDNGYLTDIRTAVAGAVAAKYMAPANISCIGIVGAGTQARYQLEYLKKVINCNKVLVWEQQGKPVKNYLDYFKKSDFKIDITNNISDIGKNCNFIVTTTPSKKPLIMLEDIKPGTHITAIGSDTADKIELDTKIVSQADIVVVDSYEQSKSQGEIFRATQAGDINRSKLTELGNIINNKDLARQNDKQITVTDLTGVAVQDIQIAKAVYELLK